jgi:hypothetical protein
VEEASQLTIGRDPQNDVVLHDGNVSRRHALIKSSDGRLQIRDEGSANGTFVNGHRLNGPAALRAGDVITIGSEQLVVDLNGAPRGIVGAVAPVPYSPVYPGQRRVGWRLPGVPLLVIGAFLVAIGLAASLLLTRPLQPDEAAKVWVEALASQDVRQVSDLTCMAQQNSIQATSLAVGAGGLLGTTLDVGGLQYSTTRTVGDQADVRVTGPVAASIGPLSTARRIDLNIRMRQESGKWRYCDDLQRIASQMR